MNSEGIFFLLAGPSGAGKTVVLRTLLAGSRNLKKDISVTTRAPRPGEVNGQDYHFWSVERFEEELKDGAFLEHAIVHGRDWYGTLKRGVLKELDRGVDVIKDIDVQGAAQVRKALPYPRSVMVFIAPTSPQELERRLSSRGTEDKDAFKRRLESVQPELARLGEYDYLVLNQVIGEAAAELEAIRRAEHARRERREGEFRKAWRDVYKLDGRAPKARRAKRR